MNESGNPCVFSPCRKWRYLLKHTWRDMLDPEERAIAWIALNPSTADENQLDPTLRRIRGYTRDMGCNTFYMLNLFAYRATDPKVMRAAEDPIGPENDYWIKKNRHGVKNGCLCLGASREIHGPAGSCPRLSPGTALRFAVYGTLQRRHSEASALSEK